MITLEADSQRRNNVSDEYVEFALDFGFIFADESSCVFHITAKIFSRDNMHTYPIKTMNIA